jgi:hypothetical protein
MGVLLGMKRRIVEALGGSLLGDVGVSGDSDPELRGFRTISDRVTTRDLNQLSHEQMVKLSLFLYSSNCLGKRIVELMTSLTIGKSVGYSITVDVEMAAAMGAKGAPTTPEDGRRLANEIRGWLDMYWQHPAHDIENRADLYAKTYLVTGHLVLPVAAVNPTSGVPQLDLIDAGQVRGVDPLAGSSMMPGAVRYVPNATTAEEKSIPVIRPDVSGALLPLEADPRGLSGCLYFANNTLLNSLRGVSYLMDVADWLDALDQGTWTSLDRAKLRNGIVWHLMVEGADTPQKISDEVAKVTGALANPGNVYGSNEKITLEAKSSNIEAADTVELHRMIRNHILGAKGIPESWYAEGGATNRATAGEQTDVAYKTLGEMQQSFRRIFRTLLWFGYDSIQAKMPRLPFRPDSPWLRLEPELPAVQERDTSRQATAVVQLETALAAGVADEFISVQSAREAFLGLVAKITGAPYELDVEVGKIEAESEGREEAEQERANAAVRAALDAAGDPEDDPEDPGGTMPPSPPKKGQAGVRTAKAAIEEEA